MADSDSRLAPTAGAEPILAPTPLPPTVLDEAPTPAAETGHNRARLTDAPPAAPEAALPQVPGYEVLGRLGHGGMGVVYEARDPTLNRRVALKMVRDGVLATAEQLARFQAEARAVARLSHPNVVHIFEIGEHNGQPWFALELVEGGSLAQRLSVVPLPPAEAATLIETLARAVQHAHEAGIVHRDLKPANVLLTKDGQPKITDFGLAKELEAEVFLTHTASGALLGTPSYMAPEQAWGQARAIGPAADVYALGAILYECLTGRPPFIASKLLDVLEMVRSQEPTPPRRLRPEVPHDLETICLKCLRKEPWQRYGSAAELADDISRWRRGEPIRARRATLTERAVKWVRRRPTAAALVAVTVVAAAVISLGLWRSARQADEAERRDRTAKEEMRRERYPATLAQAEDALATGRTDEARRLLEEECPADLRGWEWHYLKGLVDGQSTPDAYLARGANVAGAAALGDRFAAVGRDGAPVLWGAVTGQPAGRVPLKLNGEAVGLAASADGKRLAWAVARPAAEKVVPPRDEKPKDARQARRHGARDGLVALREDKGGRVQQAAPMLVRSEVVIWDVPAGRPLGPAPVIDMAVNGLALSPDGKRLALACGPRITLHRPPPPGPEKMPARAFPDKVGRGPRLDDALACADEAVALALFAPVDGGNVPIPLDTGRLVVWDVEAGKELLRVEHDHTLTAVAWRPDGAGLAVALLDGTVRTITPDGRAGLTLRVGAAALSLAYDPAGERLAVGDAEGIAHVFRAGDGQPLLVLRDHSDPVTAVAFSPDGGRLVTASVDRTAKVWEAATGRRLLTLRGHDATLVATAFDGSGRVLLTADYEGRLVFWGGNAPDGGGRRPGKAANRRVVGPSEGSADGPSVPVPDAAEKKKEEKKEEKE
jgi:hypothetical protein